jgi:hypothetical protein
MTMVARNCPEASPKLAFTQIEINLLDQLIKDKKDNSKKLPYYITKIARLGGYLARASDPPPGNLVIWRGFNRLTDIAFGFYLAKKIVCN